MNMNWICKVCWNVLRCDSFLMILFFVFYVVVEYIGKISLQPICELYGLINNEDASQNWSFSSSVLDTSVSGFSVFIWKIDHSLTNLEFKDLKCTHDAELANLFGIFLRYIWLVIVTWYPISQWISYQGHPTDRFGKLSVQKALYPLQFSKGNFHHELSW